MPDTNHYTGIPVPYAAEANVVPQVLAAQREVMGPGLRLYAATEAEMAARYGNNSIAGPTGVPVGTIVSLPTADYRRMPNNQWRMIWREPIESADAASAASEDWLISTNTVRVNGNGAANLFLTVTYQGATIAVPGNGNIANINVAQLKDAKTFPVHSVGLQSAGSGSMAQAVCAASGQVALAAVVPGTNLSSGYSINLTGTYLAWL